MALEKERGCSCPDCKFQFPDAFDAAGNLKAGR